MSTTIQASSQPLLASGDTQGFVFISSVTGMYPGMTCQISDNKGNAVSYLILATMNGRIQVGTLGTGAPAPTTRWVINNKPTLLIPEQTINQNLPRTANLVTRVVSDCRVYNPTAASTQATGAVAPVVAVNIDAGVASCGGILGEFALAQTNVSVPSAPVLTTGQSAVATLYLYVVGSTLTLLTVWGTPATTGTQVAVDPVIVANNNPTLTLCRLANTTVNRTGSTTLTQSTDNTVRDW